MKILVIEDDIDISKILKQYLEYNNYTVETALDGKTALEMIYASPYDLIVMDLMLPYISGEELLREVRKSFSTPIIILSAKTSEKSKLDGLLSGADDYVTKPFSAKEVVARVDALLRRVKEYNKISDKARYSDGNLTIDFDKMEVYFKDEKLSFTANELKILKAFINNENVVLSRNQIIDLAFDELFDGYDRNVDTYIKNIRSKIGKEYIETVYSMGYKFVRIGSKKDEN